MKLYAFDRPLPMPHAHDLAVVGGGRDEEVGRHAVALDGERMVPRDGKRRRNACEHTAAIVADRRELAVHHALRAHDASAERLADRLVSEADAQDRDLPGEALDERYG